MNVYSIINDNITELRQIATRIHCPDSEGGKVAAGIKADIIKLADKMAAEIVQPVLPVEGNAP